MIIKLKRLQDGGLRLITTVEYMTVAVHLMMLLIVAPNKKRRFLQELALLFVNAMTTVGVLVNKQYSPSVTPVVKIISVRILKQGPP